MLTIRSALREENPSIRFLTCDTDESFFVQRTLLYAASTTIEKQLRGYNHHDLLYVDDLATLNILLTWLYKHTVPITATQKVLVRAWHFGEAWNMTTFQNAVMRTLHPKIKAESTCLEALTVEYNLGYTDTVLRDLLIADMVHHAKYDRCELGNCGVMKEDPTFLMDFAEALQLSIRGEGKELKRLRDDVKAVMLRPKGEAATDAGVSPAA